MPPQDGRADRGWDALLLCLSAFILVSVGRIHQLFPALAPLNPALVAGALAILLLWLDRSRARRLRPWQVPATRWLLALVGWMALSVPGALWLGGAFQTWFGFAKTALMCLVIVAAVRNVRDAERLALVYVLAVLIFTLVVLTRFDPGDGGRLAKLYYYDANDFATLIVTALPLGVYFAVAARRPLLRVLAWAGLVPLAIGFAWSGSRGGFIALLAVIAYVLLRYTAIPKRWRLVSVAAVALLAAAAASESYWTGIRALLRPSEDYNVTSDEGRLKIWRRGLGYMMQYPVLGVGAGNFPTAEGTISPLAARQERGRGVKWVAPHNSYVQVGAELGVPGLVIFAGFLWGLFRALRGMAAAGSHSHAAVPPQLAQAATAAVLGFAVGAFFLTLAYHGMLYTLAAIVVGLQKVGATPITPVAAPSPPPSRPVRVAAPAVTRAGW